jgi:hypothetical protein
MAVGKCANPCQSTAIDCIAPNQCYPTLLGNVCSPVGVGTPLP